MNDELFEYFRKHTVLITMLIVGSFILLAAGEYYLYRQQMYLNKMFSEGLMQLKEMQQVDSVDSFEKDLQELGL